MTYVPKPSLSECSKVAKALINQYPFLNDGIGDGEVCKLSKPLGGDYLTCF